MTVGPSAAALLGAIAIAACATGPVGEDLRLGAARVRVGRIDGAGLESAVNGAPPALPDRAAYLVDLFWQAGCLAIETAPPGQRQSPDVVCSLPGRSPGRIVVLAHLDGEADERGVPWRWRGTALLPFLYRALAVEPREHSFEFAAFGKRRLGRTYGSPARLVAPGREGVLAIVEIRSLDPEAIVFAPSEPGLGQDFADASLAVGRPLDSLHWLAPGRHRIRRAGVPTIRIASPAPSQDPVSAARGGAPETYPSTARLLAVYLAYLDETLGLRAERSGRAAAGR